MPLSRKQFYMHSVVQLALLGLLHQAFSTFIFALFIGLIAFNTYRTVFDKPPLSVKLVNVIAAIVLVILITTAKQSGVLHFMLQILLLAAVLRVMGAMHLSNAQQLVWVHYFLVGCCFIIYQDMLTALFIALVLIVNIYSHFCLNSPAATAIKWRQILQSMAVIMPLWLAMFVLFPRLPPFWQIPSAKVASTGLSDTLDPGSIEKLVQDDSLAFRVEFTSSLPPKQDLYWRAYLYEVFDGRQWRVHPLRKQSETNPIVQPDFASRGDNTSYRVIAEVSQQNSLFAMATPLEVSDKAFITASGLIKSTKPVTQRLSYQVTGLNILPKLISATEKTENLKVPAGNEKTIALAQQLSMQFGQTPDLVNAIAERFNTQRYFYSLTPPILGDNAVDQFLFSTRTGFCSHYASATALILRAAGIPARVVGGYQGGQWHPEQGYLAVRQREAHAWVEYLIDDSWHRFDPTAAVAPERILNDLSSALSANEQLLLTSFWSRSGILSTLQQQFMHLDYYWSVWVLGFSEQDQHELWRSIRENLKLALSIFMCVILIFLLMITVYLWKHRGIELRPLATKLIIKQLTAVLRHKPQHLSISTYLKQVTADEPNSAVWLSPIIKAYERAVFANDNDALKQLVELLKHHHKNLATLNRRFKNT